MKVALFEISYKKKHLRYLVDVPVQVPHDASMMAHSACLINIVLNSFIISLLSYNSE